MKPTLDQALDTYDRLVVRVQVAERTASSAKALHEAAEAGTGERADEQRQATLDVALDASERLASLQQSLGSAVRTLDAFKESEAETLEDLRRRAWSGRPAVEGLVPSLLALGFARDGSTSTFWLPDGKVGLDLREDGEVALLDVRGMPSAETLPQEHAAHLIMTCDVKDGATFLERWDCYATARDTHAREIA